MQISPEIVFTKKDIKALPLEKIYEIIDNPFDVHDHECIIENRKYYTKTKV